MSIPTFPHLFRALTSLDPFPWQTALYDRFVSGDIPTSATIPTGLGKTAVVTIWLCALATVPAKCPRRLVYVVNRRTVVDQTTAEVERLRANLKVTGLHDVLLSLCAVACEVPLAVSTLRGQFADNREWCADPCRPAVIVGTVDMIGSRLLFSGYSSGFKSRPHHAAFIGQDVLLVHDEAHLEPAFSELLAAVVAEQARSSDMLKLRVLELTATSRGSQVGFQLTSADETDTVVAKRLHARKALHFHPVVDEKYTAGELARLAITRAASGAAVLIFARTIETVQRVSAELRKQRLTYEVLTGTLRGLERDALITKAVFRRFLPPSSVAPKGATPVADGTVYLVATSAGEVGINLSADHLVCDLSTFESMAQRFGRVNRFGARSDTEVDVVHPEVFDHDKPIELARRNTLALLRSLGGNASPNALQHVDPLERQAAFSPAPVILPTSDILFDAWSLTSIRGRLPGRPSVAPYLHGVSEYEPPETKVAWRAEVGVICGPLAESHPPEDLLADYPLKPHELLRDRSDRVLKELGKLALTRPDDPVWLLADDGRVEMSTIAVIANPDERDLIQGETVILAPAAGGLHDGLLDGAASPSSDGREDVADEIFDEHGRRRRIRIWNDGVRIERAPPGMSLVRIIPCSKAAAEGAPVDLDDRPTRHWLWYEQRNQFDSETSPTAHAAVLLDVHTRDVVNTATAIAAKLNIPEELRAAISLAARYHDTGKNRTSWQRTIGNDSTLLLAKAGPRQRPREFGDGYRHEFGSLVDVSRDASLAGLTPTARDIVLHLIAAHHGRGRPHFALEESFDPDATDYISKLLAGEVPCRFARLQRQFGRWGLAYIESVLRAADYAASANPSSVLEDTP